MLIQHTQHFEACNRAACLLPNVGQAELLNREGVLPGTGIDLSFETVM